MTSGFFIVFIMFSPNAMFQGAAFDLPVALASRYEKLFKSRGEQVTRATELPKLEASGYGGGYGGGRSYGRSFGGRGGSGQWGRQDFRGNGGAGMKRKFGSGGGGSYGSKRGRF